MGVETKQLQGFGPFRIDADRRELLRDGRPVPLTPKLFDALLLLAQNGDRLVTKDELMQALWPDTFVAESNLTQTIFMLRKSLGESASEQRFIVTVAGRGYRFVADVTPPPADGPAAAPGRAERPAWRARLSALALVTILVVPISIWGWRRLHTSAPSAPAARPHTPNPRAVEFYENGRLFWNKRTPAGFTEALRYFTQAVQVDPGFARGYAGMADTYALMASYDLEPQDEYMPKARAAALKALELDPKLAEAHNSLALIAQNYDWDWKTAEREYGRAIELDPNYATAHHWYAECLALQGKLNEALMEIDRARQLDPASLIIRTDRAVFLYFARRYDEAISEFRAVLALEPFFPRAFMVDYAYLQTGRFADVRNDVERWRRIGNQPWAEALLADAAALEGHRDEARGQLAKVEDWYRYYNQSDPMPLVPPFISLGEREQALHYLELAVQKHAPSVTALKADPIYDPLRNDPRYHALLKRVHLE
jgi:DNA-binding winged helix-turn-helix (wHTH) protein/tetratricopeptide (TPR) repeat protein